MSVTIYHNPRCSKSRQTLELISASGTDHKVVLYLEETPDASEIARLAEQLGVAVRDLLRTGEATFKEADTVPDLNDDAALASWLSAHPIVIERPIVVHDQSGKAIIGRPPENVNALLD